MEKSKKLSVLPKSVALTVMLQLQTAKLSKRLLRTRRAKAPAQQRLHCKSGEPSLRQRLHWTPGDPSSWQCPSGCNPREQTASTRTAV